MVILDQKLDRTHQNSTHALLCRCLHLDHTVLYLPYMDQIDSQIDRRTARLVQAAMDESGLSVKNLATRSRLRETRVRHILTGDTRPITIRELAKLADALETPLGELIPAP